MIRFENTIEISRPIEEVFRFIADFEHIPLWNYYMLSVRRLTDGLRGVGTVYHQVRKGDVQDYQITDFQPNHRVGVRTLPGSQPAFERFSRLRKRTRAAGSSTPGNSTPASIDWSSGLARARSEQRSLAIWTS